MNKTIYLVAKTITAFLAICLLLVGAGFIWLAVKAISSSTGQQSPENGLLLTPGILLLVLFLIPFCSFMLLRQHHSKYLHYLSVAVSLCICMLTVLYFVG